MDRQHIQAYFNPDSQMVEALGISDNPSSQDYLQFLMEVLQATEMSEGDSEVVYPLLQANPDKIDDNFLAVLQNWAFAILSEVESSAAEDIAHVIIYFGDLIQQFPLGNKAANVEISLVGYEISLTVFTRDSHPKDWARIQNSLGNAYLCRIKGDRGENLELAIAAYKHALEIRTKLALPTDWAGTQNNLGNAYLCRIKGDRGENLELAIAACQQALEIYTSSAFPTYWATTQHSLGNAYLHRIKGDRGENLELAIAAFQQALEIRTKLALPTDWASTQNNLGLAYLYRIKGDRGENLELAIAAFQQALEIRTKLALPTDWASTQNNLGLAYGDRIKGDKGENLELAIAACQLALEIRTQEALPTDWAGTHNNLGNAYLYRIKGDRGENLELAIAAYKHALEIRTKLAFPTDWAGTQNNLGLAYGDRIKGDRGENLELAIAAYQQALEIYTSSAFPRDWAMTQNNLGSAYFNRIKGDRNENLELAIAAYKLALEIRTQEALPRDWATTQNNLGIAYWNRLKGDRGENLELAIAAFQQALEIFTSSAFPTDWAMTKNNLGNAYFYRLKGDRGENLELAIAPCQRALEIFTKLAFPTYWASTQNNLGNAYLYRRKGDRGENLELAIAAFQLALEIRTKEALPTDWAMTKNNLGNAYLYRIKGDRGENIELAIAAYKHALEIYTPQALPTDWAGTQHNLGNAYLYRIKGDRGENIELAIAAYQQALEIRTPEADPIRCLGTSRNLGNLHFTEGNWQRAIAAYETAITAVELSRSWASTDDRREEILANAIEVYHKQVQAYINIGLGDKAIETVERSKARNLVELLANRDLDPKGDVPQETKDRLKQLRHGIPSLERQLQVAEGPSANRTASEAPQGRQQLRQELQSSRQQLNEILDRIKPIDPSFTLTQKVEPIQFREIQGLIDDRTAIIEWYITSDKILTFIVTANSPHPQVEQSDHGELEALGNWTNHYFAAYYRENEQWKADLASHLQQLAEFLKIDDILAQVDGMFEQQGGKCDRLVLIPHRFLHLFPLHAMPLENGNLLCDLFSRGISYAPSSQLLQLTQTQQRPDFQNLFAIQDPEEDLAYGFLEVEIIRSRFSPATVLATKDAREENVKTHRELSDAHCIHFSCHGEFNLESPLKSALRLAEIKHPNSGSPEDGYLTLAEIFDLKLRKSRLVTLSACETGMADPSSISDEYISLPSGFLFAGSPSVVCSQWAVNEFSTFFLMLKFYENLQQLPLVEAGTVALALNQAQKWLRHLTRDECEAFLNSLQSQYDRLIAKLPRKEGKRVRYAIEGARKQIDQLRPHPFANPYYWAAFTATGF